MSESYRIITEFKNEKNETLEYDHLGAHWACTRGEVVQYPPVFSADAEYISEFITDSLRTNRFTPICINEEDDILGCASDSDSSEMRPISAYTDVIGKVLWDGRAMIYNEKYASISFATKHSFTADEQFRPSLSDVIRCMEPSMVMKINRAYVTVVRGFCGDLFTPDGEHYGTATVFYRVSLSFLT